MQKIGILGCGWLGLALGQELVKNNYKVKGTTTTLAKMNILQENQIKPYHINLADNGYDYIDYFLQNLDYLIISIPPIRQEKVPSYSQNIQKIIPYIKKHKINKVIFMSSISIYAPSDTLIDEQYTRYSDESTAQQIRNAEKLFLDDPYINACILRLGGLFGPDRKPVRYICSQNELKNPNMPINMIHQHDIITFTKQLLEQSFTSNCIFNLVSDKYFSRLDYYSKQALEHDLTLPKLGKDDLATYRKVSGQKIVNHTNKAYLY
ncbi:Rossmann-fold NAD(P)-binding domain-containing protein [Myroides sp. LJL119]